MQAAHDPYRDIVLLEECNSDEKKAFLKLCSPMTFKKDMKLYREGERGTVLYIVWKGIVGSYSARSDGSQRDIARYSRGKFFGEMALFEGTARTSHCYAVTDAELLVLESKDFYGFIEAHPETGMKICKAMARHVTSWLFEATNFLTTMVMWGERARRRAITDELTGLYNQRFFSESIEMHVSRFRPNNGKFCLLMIDLDNIHSMNEHYGFRIADEYLKRVGQICTTVFKENAIVSRLGGDEFAILMPEASVHQAAVSAESFRRTLDADSSKWKVAASPAGQKFTASIGIAEFPLHGNSADSLKNAADEALRSAKKQGKNRVSFAS